MCDVKNNVIDDNKEILEELSKLTTATVHEAQGKKGAFNPNIKPLIKGKHICGQALTVKTGPSDNLMLIKAISMAKEGQIIVLDHNSIEMSGPFGAVLATELKTKKVSGLITNGSVRDSEDIKKMDFQVFCKNLSILGTSKVEVGTINHPIAVDNVVVNPGDYILGDDDGVVLIKKENVKEVIKESKLRDEKESVVMDRIKKGESLFDIYNYQKKFDELNIIVEN